MGQIMSLFQASSTIMVSPPSIDQEFIESNKYPKFELHLHLDGAIRHATLLELAQQKKIDLKGAKTVEEVKRVVVSHEPANLSKVLSAFDLFLPCIIGDKDAIERVAYELCEDQAKNSVCYFEARYSPHLLCNTIKDHKIWPNDDVFREKGDLSPQNVVEAVKRGFDRGEKEFKLTARSILCCIRGYEDWNNEVLELGKFVVMFSFIFLATNLKHLGVVAIDVAGCASGADEKYEPSVIKVFKAAAERGIHRTVHAGESGGPKSVINAIEEMKAERIGHGYRLTNDEAAYQKYALEKRIHFEACPYSSIMTGAVPLNWPEHPIKRWAKDGVSFSINTDDPTCFDNTILTDMRIARDEIGLNALELWKTQFDACAASFLPDEEKVEMFRLLKNFEPKTNHLNS
uniref:Adenosine deaminase n=1 Tax=Panagrolaimus sp. JU765 TaxID=591449 RepID=A0AC34RI43_9BILA